jgi:voltage-dependent calcium channel alpha-2/delta-3
LFYKGIPINPEDQDNYYKNRGPIPSFQNEYGCIQDAVRYSVDEKVLGGSKLLIGNVSGPCMSGFYYVVALPKTNLFLLAIENWQDYKKRGFYNFNCEIARK